MTTHWRLLRDRKPYTDFSVSVSPAVERSVASGEAGPTVFLNVFGADSVTIGVNEDPLQVLDIDVCREHGIAFRRRVNGGGAVYAGAGSAFICLYLPIATPGAPQTSTEAFPKILTMLAEVFEERYGFPARYRALNDVEVEGRKLAPTSLKIENGVMTFRIVLNVKPIDSALAAKALPMPPEKVKDKVHKDLGSRYTWLEREAGREIDEAELEAIAARLLERVFGDVALVGGELSSAEQACAAELNAYLSSDEWLYGKSEHVRLKLQEGDRIGRARHKSVGGLIWAALQVRGDVIVQAIVNGDWHPRPSESVGWLEDALAGCPARADAVIERTDAFLARSDVEFAGVELSDLEAALTGALADARQTASV